MSPQAHREAQYKTRDLAVSFIEVLDSLERESQQAVTGPTISDTINAKLLAVLVKRLPKEVGEKTSSLLTYLEKHSEIATWLRTKLGDVEGRRDLKALLRLELGM